MQGPFLITGAALKRWLALKRINKMEMMGGQEERRDEVLAITKLRQ